MTYTNFTVDVDEDGIALLTVNVPDQTMNVWTPALIEEITAFSDEFLSNGDMKGLVFCSGKENGFMAGADLKMMEKMASAGGSPKEAFDRAMGLSRVLRRLETGGHSPKEIAKEGKKAKPVAAALEGLALGGGLELPLACHYRVVADNPKIQLGLPEVLVGLLPGAGGTQRTLRLMGLQNAALLCTQGRPLDPKTAKAQGLIHEIVAPGTAVAAAKAWVKANSSALAPWDQKGYKVPGGAGAMHPAAVQFHMGSNAMALKESKGNYPAIKAILSCIYEGSQLPMDKAIEIEVKYMMWLMAQPGSRNMIRSLFLNKQVLEKGQARPKGIEKATINKVGVLGAGLMGSGITHVTAKAGMEVIVLDRSEEDAAKAVAYTQRILDKRVARGRMTKEKAGEFIGRIHPTADYSDLADVDLIIEAVFEMPDIKADVIRKTEAVIGEDVIFASNTSTLPIGGLAENSKRPDQFIGMHFFSPVDKMPLLEIIPHEGTGDRALATAFDYNMRIRKTPIVVRDVRGFYTNQVFPPYAAEAMTMVAEGVRPALIENVAVHMGMPVGPLAVVDETSFKLGYDLAQATKQQLGDAYEETVSSQLNEKMYIELGRNGRRSGGGFYEYPGDGSPKFLWQGINEHYPLLESQPTPEEVRERLMFIQLIATAKCYADGVVSDPQSADLGAIFGWGFAPQTGGPISLIDTIGTAEFVAKADSLAQKYGERFSVPAFFRELGADNTGVYDAHAKAA